MINLISDLVFLLRVTLFQALTATLDGKYFPFKHNNIYLWLMLSIINIKNKGKLLQIIFD